MATYDANALQITNVLGEKPPLHGPPERGATRVSGEAVVGRPQLQSQRTCDLVGGFDERMFRTKVVPVRNGYSVSAYRGQKINANVFVQSFSRTLRVMDVRAENRGRPHQKVRFSAAPVMGGSFLTQGRPGVRVRNAGNPDQKVYVYAVFSSLSLRSGVGGSWPLVVKQTKKGLSRRGRRSAGCLVVIKQPPGFCRKLLANKTVDRKN